MLANATISLFVFVKKFWHNLNSLNSMWRRARLAEFHRFSARHRWLMNEISGIQFQTVFFFSSFQTLLMQWKYSPVTENAFIFDCFRIFLHFKILERKSLRSKKFEDKTNNTRNCWISVEFQSFYSFEFFFDAINCCRMLKKYWIKWKEIVARKTNSKIHVESLYCIDSRHKDSQLCRRKVAAMRSERK